MRIRIRAYKQTGERKDLHLDKMLSAHLPGWRISKNKKRYFEARKNRSDVKGKKI